jgi:hypothetical protein
MKKVVLIGVMIFLSVFGFSQSGNYQLPKVVPPSPAEQNFLRYGDIPVDISTGVPSIGVPLYTVTSRKLQFPISASYHASGIKVGDKASVIGLGWVLNINGNFSFTILGGFNRFDTVNRVTHKSKDAFNYARDIMDVTEFINLVELERDSRDWQPERFSFTLPTGLSGTFRYNYITGELLKLPFGSYKVQRFFGIYPPFTDTCTTGFAITDDKGDVYTYGFLPGFNTLFGPHPMNILSIISADKTDTIRFVYKQGVYNTYEQAAFGAVLDVGDDAVGLDGWPPTYQPTATLSRMTNRSTTKEPILDSIITTNEIVKIISVADRADMAWHQGRYRTTKLEIFKRFKGDKLKEIKFAQSYFGSSGNNNQRLRLDSIEMKGSIGVISERYKFDYETAIQLPPRPEDDTTASTPCSEDYWGYFNNTSSYYNIPQEFITIDTFVSTYTGFKTPIPIDAGTNRNPDHNYAKAALIKSITYPTGGRTVFDFEPNWALDAYAYPGQSPLSGFVGGFRVHQIKNYSDPTTLVETKTYKYSPGITRTITSDLYVYQQRVYKEVLSNGDFWKTSADHTIYTSNSFLPLQYDHGPPVFYEKVTEYIGDTVNNAGKTEYVYLWPIATIHASSDHPRFQNPYEQDRGSYTPLLSQKIEYRKEGSQFLPVKKMINTYSTYKNSYFPTGMHFVHTSSYPTGYGLEPSSFGFYDNIHYSTLGTKNYYRVFDLSATQAVDKLTQSETTVYSNSDTTKKLLETSFFIYDTLTHLQLKEQRLIGSKGDTLKTKFKYPVDYAGTAVYDSMVARNIISATVEQSQYKNNDFLQSSRTHFYPWSSTLIAPQTVESKTLTNSAETRLRFHGYDSKANTLSVSKENDTKISYIWGYNQTLPVAEVVNAASNEIFFEGFEEAGTWDSPAVLDAEKPHTGKYSGRITNATSGESICHSTKWLTISPAAPAKYKYSGWIFSNGPQVEIILFMKRNGESGYYSYIDNITTTVTGKWVYLEKEFIVPADVTQLNLRIDNNSTGTVWYDDIRLHPAAAVMVTYTYMPLVGITSRSDGNSRPMHYEYDAFNRLTLIRNQDNYIVKKICYNYAGQPEDCFTYYSVAKSGNFTRNNCANGGTGGTVTYTVAAGTYSSSTSQAAADALAQNDVNTNGQAYANANATCTFYNTTVNNYFTRNNCGSGYIGSSVFYQIAANTYSSTVSQAAANQLAFDALNTNGQANANTNGTCTAAVGINVSNYAAPSGCYMVEFHNTSTFELFYFYISSTGTLGYIPPGTYDIGFYEMSSCDGVSRTFSVCSASITNTGGAYFTNQTINSSTCYSISVQ